MLACSEAGVGLCWCFCSAALTGGISNGLSVNEVIISLPQWDRRDNSSESLSWGQVPAYVFLSTRPHIKLGWDLEKGVRGGGGKHDAAHLFLQIVLFGCSAGALLFFFFPQKPRLFSCGEAEAPFHWSWIKTSESDVRWVFSDLKSTRTEGKFGGWRVAEGPSSGRRPCFRFNSIINPGAANGTE